MTRNDLLQSILRFLNFPEDATFMDMREFLLETGLCRFELKLSGNESETYSLYSRQAVLARKAEGLPVGFDISLAAAPVDESKAHTLLSDPKDSRERIVFPDDGPDDGDGSESGETARFRRAFRSAVGWFRLFMAGCASGVVDVETLNKFRTTRKLIMEFKGTKDPMNPILVPVGKIEDEPDDIIERRILAEWIYPFIFTDNGHELSHVHRCRNCGAYFLGKRASATFCTTKCRMAHYYVSRS